MVFDGLFGSDRDGMLRSSGTVLVTHAVQFLPRVDYILVMSEGSPSFFGTWAELQQLEGLSREVITLIQASKHGDGDERKRKGPHGKGRKDGMAEKDGFIMTVEEREYGVAHLSVWIMWLHNAGGWVYVALQVIFLILDRGLYVASEW
jgi:ATP-binding cassette subfamily C (CFTR/MRP) protein 1